MMVMASFLGAIWCLVTPYRIPSLRRLGTRPYVLQRRPAKSLGGGPRLVESYIVSLCDANTSAAELCLTEE